jgi:hypothetical protein
LAEFKFVATFWPNLNLLVLFGRNFRTNFIFFGRHFGRIYVNVFVLFGRNFRTNFIFFDRNIINSSLRIRFRHNCRPKLMKIDFRRRCRRMSCARLKSFGRAWSPPWP